jgi:hypothetical protein
MDYEYLFMTKSATEPFHCGVHTQPALHKPYRRRLDFHLTAQPRRLGSLRGQDGGNCVSSRICSASDLVRNRRAEIMASHWAAVESRKIQEKNRHFRKHRYDVGIVRAEARGPARSVLSGRPGDVKRSPNAASRSAAVGLSASGEGMRKDGETKSRLSC